MIKVNKKQLENLQTQEGKLIETIAANELTVEKQKQQLIILQKAISSLQELEKGS